MKQFEIWTAALPPLPDSHVQQGFRPVLIVSNDVANNVSPVVTVVPLTTQLKKPLPTHVLLHGQGLDHASTALCECIMTLDKCRLTKRIGYVYRTFDRLSIRHALSVQLGMAA